LGGNVKRKVTIGNEGVENSRLVKGECPNVIEFKIKFDRIIGKPLL